MATVDKSMVTNLQGLALLRLYRSFRGWLWQKPPPCWVGRPQRRAVGAAKSIQVFQHAGQIYLAAFGFIGARCYCTLDAARNKMMDEEQQIWLRVLGPWKDLLCRAMPKLVEIFRL